MIRTAIIGTVAGLCAGVVVYLEPPSRHPAAAHAEVGAGAAEKTVRETVRSERIFASLPAAGDRQPSALRMFFMGDMMFDRDVAARTARSNDPAYAFARIRGSDLLRDQDLVVANLEGPVASKRALPEKSIDFAFGPTIPAVLKAMGIDAVSQANNHSLDQGRDGADTSRSALQASGIAVFGDGVRDDATSSLAILERRGQKIALLGFNTTDNPLDESAALESIGAAHHEASRVVVFMHWGVEYAEKPTSEQVRRAHWFIDHGADAVIGAHPHVVEPVEVYRGRVIAYSLGNFIFDQDWSAETRFGLAVGLVFSDDPGSRDSEAHLFPIKIIQSQPELLSGEERMKRLQHLAEISDPSLDGQIRSGVISARP